MRQWRTREFKWVAQIYTAERMNNPISCFFIECSFIKSHWLVLDSNTLIPLESTIFSGLKLLFFFLFPSRAWVLLFSCQPAVFQKRLTAGLPPSPLQSNSISICCLHTDHFPQGGTTGVMKLINSYETAARRSIQTLSVNYVITW